MGMGNPLLDIGANDKQDRLDKYELKPDTATRAEDTPSPLTANTHICTSLDWLNQQINAAGMAATRT